jgi:hypothetical protein
VDQIGVTVTQLMQQWQKERAPAGPQDPEQVLKKILTKRELGHIKIKSFRKGTLGIAVDSSTWLYALGSRKEEIADALRGANPSIKDVRFYLGEVS